MTMVVADLHAETPASRSLRCFDARLAIQAAQIPARLSVMVVQESNTGKARILYIVVDRPVISACLIAVRTVVENDAAPDALAAADHAIPHDRAHGILDVEHDKPPVDAADLDARGIALENDHRTDLLVALN